MPNLSTGKLNLLPANLNRSMNGLLSENFGVLFKNSSLWAKDFEANFFDFALTGFLNE
jgi:hypothetical protein